MTAKHILSGEASVPGRTGPGAHHVGGVGERIEELGVIERVGDYDDVPAGAPVDDYGDLVLMPGVVDSHVHVNEPGRTEWEGFETATRAAAAGGVTTIVDMPLNSIPPTTSVAALETKLQRDAREVPRRRRRCGAARCRATRRSSGRCSTRRRARVQMLPRRLRRRGVRAASTRADCEAALDALRRHDAPLLVHAELPEHIHARDGDARSYASYLGVAAA